MKPHKHDELIKAWADGHEIECLYNGEWVKIDNPIWAYRTEYRIKPSAEIKTVNNEFCDNRCYVLGGLSVLNLI